MTALTAMLWLAPLWRGFDVFRQLWPVWAGLALIALTLVWINRHRSARWIMLAIALLVWLPGLGETARRMTDRRGPAADGSFTLRVATHNMWGGNNRPEFTAATLAGLDADVLAVQESYGGASRAGVALEQAYSHSARCRSTRILSRYEILESGCVRPVEPIDWAHAVPCDWEVPPATWARIRLPDGDDAVVVSVHLTWPFPGAAQDCQRAGLARFLGRMPHDRMIVMGDFNAAAPSIALVRLERDLGLRRRTIALPSFPSGARLEHKGWPRPPAGPMLLGIDHVFAGNAWQTVAVGLGPYTGSDHRPVIVELARR